MTAEEAEHLLRAVGKHDEAERQPRDGGRYGSAGGEQPPAGNRAFFEEVLVRMRDHIHLVVARDRASKRLVAGAFNLLGQEALYGRYWGALEDRNFLHFEVCFYRGIEDAIARKLAHFEPGAGGEHKLARGFEATATYSAHHLVDPRFDHAVRDFLRREDEALRAEIVASRAQSGLRPLAGEAGVSQSEE